MLNVLDNVMLGTVIKFLSLKDIFALYWSCKDVRCTIKSICWASQPPREFVARPEEFPADYFWIADAISKLQVTSRTCVDNALQIYARMKEKRLRFVDVHLWFLEARRLGCDDALRGRVLQLLDGCTDFALKFSPKSSDQYVRRNAYVNGILKDLLQKLAVRCEVLHLELSVAWDFCIPKFQKARSVHLKIYSAWGPFDEKMILFLDNLSAKKISLFETIALYAMVTRSVNYFLDRWDTAEKIELYGSCHRGLDTFPTDIVQSLQLTEKNKGLRTLGISGIHISQIHLTAVPSLVDISFPAALIEYEDRDFSSLGAIAPQLQRLNLSFCTLKASTTSKIFSSLQKCQCLNVWCLSITEPNDAIRLDNGTLLEAPDSYHSFYLKNGYPFLLYAVLRAPCLRWLRGPTCRSMRAATIRDGKLFSQKSALKLTGTHTGTPLVLLGGETGSWEPKDISATVQELLAIRETPRALRECNGREYWLQRVLDQYTRFRYLQFH